MPPRYVEGGTARHRFTSVRTLAHPRTAGPCLRSAQPPPYRSGVLRTALRPRWLALLVLVLALCGAFAWLGSWQLGVARDRGAEAAAREIRSQPVIAIGQVLAPQRSFPPAAEARRVTAEGSYDPTRHVLVAQRLQHGRPGWWVVTALRTDAGAWLPVVRGWVASKDDATAGPAAVPRGAVRVTGVLQPDDPPAAAAPEVSEGQLAQLDAAELVNRWGSPIYNGYLLLSTEQASQPSAQPERVPAPTYAPQGIAWRNAAYAAQWWAFAGFALLLWWKMVRQSQLDRSPDRSDVKPKVTVG